MSESAAFLQSNPHTLTIKHFQRSNFQHKSHALIFSEHHQPLFSSSPYLSPIPYKLRSHPPPQILNPKPQISGFIRMDNNRTTWDLQTNMNNNNVDVSGGVGGGGVPKFKSFLPPELQQTSIFSPTTSSFLNSFSPSQFLDSPVLFSSNSNLIPSPTTGTFDWRNSSLDGLKVEEQNDHNYPNNFSFQTHTSYNNNHQTSAAAAFMVSVVFTVLPF